MSGHALEAAKDAVRLRAIPFRESFQSKSVSAHAQGVFPCGFFSNSSRILQAYIEKLCGLFST
jgi:hypothetical protein